MSGAPGIRLGNVFILAGVPHIAALMLEALDGKLEGGEPVVSRTIGCWVPESEIADMLGATERAHAGCQIGSYPVLPRGAGGREFRHPLDRSGDRRRLHRRSDERADRARPRRGGGRHLAASMARILIGWELGANTGHIVKIAGIAAELVARGHEPVLAAPAHRAPRRPAMQVWQAPLWPTQLATLSRSARDHAGDDGRHPGGARPWRHGGDARADRRVGRASSRRCAPDLVVAEFAPGLMMAAQGRVPLLALGTGFSLPPPHLPYFASLTGKPAVEDEGRLLDGLNAALARQRPAAARPADRACSRPIARSPPCSANSIPIASGGRSEHGAPSVMPAPALATGGGDELFVYMNGLTRWPDGFWQGMVDARLKVRVYDPRLRDADAAVLTKARADHRARGRCRSTRIVARSRAVLSHGGLGMACSSLLAGLPMLFVPFDIEKRMVAASVVELGLGRRLDFELVEAARLAGMMRDAFDDEAMGRRARAAAPGFRARMARTCEQETADAVEEMLG